MNEKLSDGEFQFTTFNDFLVLLLGNSPSDNFSFMPREVLPGLVSLSSRGKGDGDEGKRLRSRGGRKRMRRRGEGGGCVGWKTRLRNDRSTKNQTRPFIVEMILAEKEERTQPYMGELLTPGGVT